MGLLVRRPWSAKRPEIRPDDEIGNQLWNSGRHLHVHISLGDGRQTLNILVVYGIAGQRMLNFELMQTVMEYRARLGNSATVIAADFNLNLDLPLKLPPQWYRRYPVAVLLIMINLSLVVMVRIHVPVFNMVTTYQPASMEFLRTDVLPPFY